MTRRILAGLGALVLAAGLAACGADVDDDDDFPRGTVVYERDDDEDDD